jgi:hypothetical protein
MARVAKRAIETVASPAASVVAVSSTRAAMPSSASAKSFRIVSFSRIEPEKSRTRTMSEAASSAAAPAVGWTIQLDASDAAIRATPRTLAMCRRT